MSNPANRPPETGSTLSRRFATYFMGVAIGLVILGMFQILKSQSASSSGANQGSSGEAEAGVGESDAAAPTEGS